MRIFKAWAIAVGVVCTVSAVLWAVALSGLAPWWQALPGLRVAGDKAARAADQSAEAATWPAPFEHVEIRSTRDGQQQPAYVYIARGASPRPLLMSLHTWSGDYTQADPLAKLAQGANWHYIHPDFRGPNRSASACLSELVLADLDDALDFMLKRPNADPQNVFVVGCSGGGHATLGFFLRTRHRVKLCQAWVPISDLTAWYDESRARGNEYADDLLQCIADTSQPGGVSAAPAAPGAPSAAPSAVGELGNLTSVQRTALAARSPLAWDVPAATPGRLEIFAGVHDGHEGSVPISHSIDFYNRLASAWGAEEAQLVSAAERQRWLQREGGPLTAGAPTAVASDSTPLVGGRAVWGHRSLASAGLVIFEGGHEILTEYAFERLERAAQQPGPINSLSWDPSSR